MSDQSDFIKKCIRTEFIRGKNAQEACESICSALGEGVVTYTQCRYWYRRFEIGDFAIGDESAAAKRTTPHKLAPKKD